MRGYNVFESSGRAETPFELRDCGRPPGNPIQRKHEVRPLPPSEILSAKQAFSVRRVDRTAMSTLVTGPIRPRTGDVVLARIDRILHQSRLELTNGRKALLHVGDTIIVAYGDRYATDQFEAEVPLNLGPTNLVATGGVASRMLSRTQGLKGATEITPLGLIGDAQGNPLNLKDFSLPLQMLPDERPKVIAVLGTSMNSGKTTTNRYLTAGLSRAGYHPGVAKITGTGSGGDYWAMHDAGAHAVVDFTDAGYSATYKITLTEIETIMRDLIAHLSAAGAGVILLEIADGIFQEQNSELIESPVFRELVDGIFFAAGEALGAALGVAKLQMLGLPVIGVSGKLTTSELLIREATPVCGAPIYRKEQLADPAVAPSILSLAPRPSAGDEPHHLAEVMGGIAKGDHSPAMMIEGPQFMRRSSDLPSAGALAGAGA